jgi:hypothetical protein
MTSVSGTHAGGPDPTAGGEDASGPAAAPAAGDIGLGARGDAVRDAQAKLAALGLLKGPVDGIFGRLTEAAVAAFQRASGLPARGSLDAATLEKLDGGAGAAPATPPAPAPSPATAAPAEAIRAKLDPDGEASFDRLLAAGNRDVLAPLAALAAAPRDPRLGTSTGEVLKEVIEEVEDPGKVQQGMIGTCGPTTLQYVMARDHAAEFVKIVDQLTRPGLQATTLEGARMSVPDDAVKDDKTWYNVVERVFQSSVENSFGGLVARAGRVMDGHHEQGLTVGAARDAYQQMTGVPADAKAQYTWWIFSVGDDPKQTLDRIESSIDDGADVMVCLDWDRVYGFHEGHYLAAERIEYDDQGRPQAVILRNPWGADELADPASGGPKRALVNGEGEVRVAWADFAKSLQGAVFPREDYPNDREAPSADRVAALRRMLSEPLDGARRESIFQLFQAADAAEMSAMLDAVPAASLLRAFTNADERATALLYVASFPDVANNARHLGELVAAASVEDLTAFATRADDDVLEDAAATPGGQRALAAAAAALERNGSDAAKAAAEKIRRDAAG